MRTMSDLSTFPLEFQEPIPAVLQERLHPSERAKLVCVTTTGRSRNGCISGCMGPDTKAPVPSRPSS